MTEYWCDGCGVLFGGLPAVKRAIGQDVKELAFHSFECYQRARDASPDGTLELPVVKAHLQV